MPGDIHCTYVLYSYTRTTILGRSTGTHIDGQTGVYALSFRRNIYQNESGGISLFLPLSFRVIYVGDGLQSAQRHTITQTIEIWHIECWEKRDECALKSARCTLQVLARRDVGEAFRSQPFAFSYHYLKYHCCSRIQTTHTAEERHAPHRENTAGGDTE